MTAKTHVAFRSWGDNEGCYSASEKTASLEVIYLGYNLLPAISIFPALWLTNEGECRLGLGEFTAMLLSLSEEERILSTIGHISHIRQIPLLGLRIREVEMLLVAIVTKGDYG